MAGDIMSMIIELKPFFQKVFMRYHDGRIIIQKFFQDLPVISQYTVDKFCLLIISNFLIIMILIPAPFVAKFFITPAGHRIKFHALAKY